MYMDKSSVTLATLQLSSALVRMVGWQKGLSRPILLCVPLRSFFIRESLCKQLPSIDWDVRSERCTFLMELLTEPGPGNCRQTLLERRPCVEFDRKMAKRRARSSASSGRVT